MKRKDETLRGTLLDMAREIAGAEGPEAISIRAIAKKAGIAQGTVYNYFSGKDEILLALTEEYWKKTLVEMREAIGGGSFCDQLGEIYHFLSGRIFSSAGMLMDSLRNVEAVGQERMYSMQKVLRSALIQRMEQDAAIRTDIWTDGFTKERYAAFVLSNLLISLRMRAPDAGFFIEIVKRTLY